MSDISKISVDEVTYNIKDANARQSQQELLGRLGTLAYKNEATGTMTPAGIVTAPNVDVVPTTKTVKIVKSAGTLPSWSANVNDETLSFTFSAGALTTTSNQTVVTGISDVTASTPIFSGSSSTVIVS